MTDDARLGKLEEKIGKVPKIFRDLKESNPELYNSVMGLDQMVWADGVLTRKEKKLIAIAIAAAMRDAHSVRAQIAGAPHLGVSLAEIEEALRVTFLLAGMPAYVHGRAAAEEYYKK
ncbi:MAG TPA: carboxymuconolactone decarboxylase family protein [Methanoregulaceae archaeon]|nr:carboxymuconolactone decarboxylase family protein [Methanoregulaceae archaeon]HQJ87763.1 carboxymuconolactone decarboxylase family protein [Methanoregulaceae archaeon]